MEEIDGIEAIDELREESSIALLSFIASIAFKNLD